MPAAPSRSSRNAKHGGDVVLFPAHDDHGPHTQSLGRLPRFPAMLDAILPILLPELGSKAPSTRNRVISSLSSGLLKFLEEQSLENASPADIDYDMVSRFIWWLDRTKDGRAVLSVQARRSYLGDARTLLAPVSRSKGHERLAEAIGSWPRNPWPDAGTRRRGIEGVPDAAAMKKLLRHCRREVERRIAETEPLLAMFEAGDASEAVVATALKLRERFLVEHAEDPEFQLAQTVEAICDGEAARRFQEHFAPGVAEMMPFLIILLHYTRFNPAVLFDLRLEDVRMAALGTTQRIVLCARKRRPIDSWQTATFAVDGSSTNPARLLDFIRRWTAIGRSTLKSGNYFVAQCKSNFVEVGAYSRVTGGTFMGNPMASLLQTAGLPKLVMTDVRKGVLDLVHLETGDTEVVRGAGGQGSQQVVIDHYRSRSADNRDLERLAEGFEERERWLYSDGLIDARGLPEKSDRSAATPGFSCLDRHASPMPGQRGQVCHAYGKCPICPLAIVDVSSERSCAYAHLLLDAVERSFDAQDAMSAGAYLGIWLPVAQRLADTWLPAFPDDVRDRAKKLDLPPLPEIE